MKFAKIKGPNTDRDFHDLDYQKYYGDGKRNMDVEIFFLVDLGGVAPPIRPCHGRVLLLYYRPVLILYHFFIKIEICILMGP